MDNKTKITLFTLAGIFGFSAITDAAVEIKYKDFLNSTKNYTAPFDDVTLWENGTESNDVNGKILTLAALSLVDYNQSKDMFSSNQGYYEFNPILGSHPSLPKMATFGLVGIGTVYIAEKLLNNHPNLQQILIDSVLSSEAFNINENTRLVQIGYRQQNVTPILITVRW